MATPSPSPAPTDAASKGLGATPDSAQTWKSFAFTFGLQGAVMVFMLTLFAVLRHSKAYRGLYRTTTMQEVRAQYPRLQKRPPPPYPSGLLRWMFSASKLSERELFRQIGLDGYIVIRFCRMGFKICLFGCIGAVVMTPLYLNGDNDTTGGGPTTLTILHLKQESDVIWVAVIWMWLFSVHVIRMVRDEYARVMVLRLEYLATGDCGADAQAGYTVLVQRLPKQCQTPPQVRRFFETLYPGRVYCAAVARYAGRLRAALARRESDLRGLEKACQIAYVTGHPPKIRVWRVPEELRKPPGSSTFSSDDGNGNGDGDAAADQPTNEPSPAPSVMPPLSFWGRVKALLSPLWGQKVLAIKYYRLRLGASNAEATDQYAHFCHKVRNAADKAAASLADAQSGGQGSIFGSEVGGSDYFASNNNANGFASNAGTLRFNSADGGGGGGSGGGGVGGSFDANFNSNASVHRYSVTSLAEQHSETGHANGGGGGGGGGGANVANGGEYGMRQQHSQSGPVTFFGSVRQRAGSEVEHLPPLPPLQLRPPLPPRPSLPPTALANRRGTQVKTIGTLEATAAIIDEDEGAVTALTRHLLEAQRHQSWAGLRNRLQANLKGPLATDSVFRSEEIRPQTDAVTSPMRARSLSNGSPTAGGGNGSSNSNSGGKAGSSGGRAGSGRSGSQQHFATCPGGLLLGPSVSAFEPSPSEAAAAHESGLPTSRTTVAASTAGNNGGVHDAARTIKGNGALAEGSSSGGVNVLAGKPVAAAAAEEEDKTEHAPLPVLRRSTEVTKISIGGKEPQQLPLGQNGSQTSAGRGSNNDNLGGGGIAVERGATRGGLSKAWRAESTTGRLGLREDPFGKDKYGLQLTWKALSLHRILTFTLGGLIEALETVLGELQLLTVGTKGARTAFVTFSDLATAAQATQAKAADGPSLFLTNHAPEPRDIVWRNANTAYLQTRHRAVLVNILLIVAALYWSQIVGFVVTAKDKVLEKPPFSSWINNPFADALLSNIIPSAVLLVLIAALSPILMLICHFYEGYASVSEMQMKTLWRLYWFQVANAFVLVTSIGLLDLIKDLIKNPISALQHLGDSIPSSSVYSTSVILSKMSLGLLGPEVFKYHLFVAYSLRLCSRRPKFETLREKREGFFQPCFAFYPTIFAGSLLVLLIVMVYQCIAPYITAVGVLYFLLAEAVFKYQFLHFYLPVFATPCLAWERVYWAILISLVGSQLVLTGYTYAVGGHKALKTTFALVPLPIMVMFLGFKYRFLFGATQLPLNRAMQQDRRGVEIDARDELAAAQFAAAAAEGARPTNEPATTKGAPAAVYDSPCPLTPGPRRSHAFGEASAQVKEDKTELQLPPHLQPPPQLQQPPRAAHSAQPAKGKRPRVVPKVTFRRKHRRRSSAANAGGEEDQMNDDAACWVHFVPPLQVFTPHAYLQPELKARLEQPLLPPQSHGGGASVYEESVYDEELGDVLGELAGNEGASTVTIGASSGNQKAAGSGGDSDLLSTRSNWAGDAPTVARAPDPAQRAAARQRHHRRKRRSSVTRSHSGGWDSVGVPADHAGFEPGPAAEAGVSVALLNSTNNGNGDWDIANEHSLRESTQYARSVSGQEALARRSSLDVLDVM